MANLEGHNDLGLGIFLAGNTTGKTADTTADGTCCAGAECGGILRRVMAPELLGWAVSAAFGFGMLVDIVSFV